MAKEISGLLGTELFFKLDTIVSAEAQVGSFVLDLDAVSIDGLNFLVRSRREVGKNLLSRLFRRKEEMLELVLPTRDVQHMLVTKLNACVVKCLEVNPRLTPHRVIQDYLLLGATLALSGYLLSRVLKRFLRYYSEDKKYQLKKSLVCHCGQALKVLHLTCGHLACCEGCREKVLAPDCPYRCEGAQLVGKLYT